MSECYRLFISRRVGFFEIYPLSFFMYNIKRMYIGRREREREESKRERERRRSTSCRSATSSNNVYWSVNTSLGISDAAPTDRARFLPCRVATRERARISRDACGGATQQADVWSAVLRRMKRLSFFLFCALVLAQVQRSRIPHVRQQSRLRFVRGILSEASQALEKAAGMREMQEYVGCSL